MLLVAVVVLYVSAGWLKSRLYGHEPSALVGFGCAGSASCFAEFNRASLPERAVVFRSGGYDGQFFYYLGRELFGGPRAVVDSLPFRRARIGLPLLAGPLLALGDLGRVYGLPLTLLGLHLLSVWVLARERAQQRCQLVAFAFNPFSLLSFMLSTADGAALSLAVMGALAVRATKWTRPGGFFLLAFALLTKETLVAVPLALAGALIFDASLPAVTRVMRASIVLSTLLPLLVWWHEVGFSFGLAATHGGLPFSGFFRYLPHADLTRALLALELVLTLPFGVLLARAPRSRIAGFVLVATAALISTATAEEYWSTISNVGRLFTPMVAAPALLGDARCASGAEIVSSSAVNGVASSNSLALWTARFGVAWTTVLLALTVVLVVREATRHALPFFVLVR